MNVRNFSLVLAVVAMSVSSVSAQNFFWSTAGFGEGAVNGDFEATVQQGATGTTHLYYAPNGQNVTEGLDLDFSWDNSGVMSFTAAETLDFDLSFMGAPLGVRWGDFAGPAESVTADAVTGFLTVNVVAGEGMQIANIPPGMPLIDEGYDESAGAFWVGTFDWSADGQGTASIVIDNALVVDGGQDIGATFNSFTVNVVPEPAAASVLALGLVGLVARRRR